MATELYRKAMDWAASKLDADGMVQQRKTWEVTPWMVDVYTGWIGEERDREMRRWCGKAFGEEARPIHGRPGAWQRGGATVNGWTWFGFASEEMMERFLAAWP
jgi:hypothetical protein